MAIPLDAALAIFSLPNWDFEKEAPRSFVSSGDNRPFYGFYIPVSSYFIKCIMWLARF